MAQTGSLTGLQVHGASDTAPIANSVAIRYLESAPVFVQGNATGRQYRFSGAAPVQAVDARDAVALLNSRFFRRERGSSRWPTAVQS